MCVIQNRSFVTSDIKMILSVSRRTDIPAFYSDWFFNRIKAGYVDVRNPMNIHRVSRVKISKPPIQRKVG